MNVLAQTSSLALTSAGSHGTRSSRCDASSACSATAAAAASYFSKADGVTLANDAPTARSPDRRSSGSMRLGTVMCSPSTSCTLRVNCSAVRRRSATGPASTGTAGEELLQPAAPSNINPAAAVRRANVKWMVRTGVLEADARQPPTVRSSRKPRNGHLAGVGWPGGSCRAGLVWLHHPPTPTRSPPCRGRRFALPWRRVAPGFALRARAAACCGWEPCCSCLRVAFRRVPVCPRARPSRAVLRL